LKPQDWLIQVSFSIKQTQQIRLQMDIQEKRSKTETLGLGPIASMFWIDDALCSSIYLDGVVAMVDAKYALQVLCLLLLETFFFFFFFLK